MATLGASISITTILVSVIRDLFSARIKLKRANDPPYPLATSIHYFSLILWVYVDLHGLANPVPA